MRIGVDVGGTKIAVGLVSDRGELLKKSTIPTLRGRSGEALVADIASIIRDMTEETEYTIIGLGVPGCIDCDSGLLVHANNIGDNIPFKELLRYHFPNKIIHVNNDATCALIGEKLFGTARDYKNLIMLTLGTGIGCGIIVNNEIYNVDGSGEVGHMTINFDGIKCSCGQNGCWEAYASATGLSRIIKESEVNYNTRSIFEAAKAGEVPAIEILKIYINYLAIGICNLINVFAPDTIIIGGGLGNEGDFLFPRLREKLGGMVYKRPLTCDIVSANFGNNAGIIGAAFISEN